MAQHVSTEAWPELPWNAWKASCETLHLWAQIVGKVKLALSPFLNEWWNVGFEVTPRGLTTASIPFASGAFAIDFDFIDHDLTIATSMGTTTRLALAPCSVADFYRELMSRLRHCGIDVGIDPVPVEVPDPIPFTDDVVHSSYDPAYVHRWWRILLGTANVLARYRSPFFGKSSPILFYWGSFDLSETRFSGRPAPRLTGVPRFFQLAEDQENIACGFWPGNPNAAGVELGEPAFYSYLYPAVPGYREAAVEPTAAGYDDRLNEFILPYDAVRVMPSPEQAILDFFQSTYEAGATLAGWDRTLLEHPLDVPRRARTTRPEELPGRGGGPGAADARRP